MAKKLNETDKEFRDLVIRLDGATVEIADELGIKPCSVSCRLNSEKHGSWWRRFKNARSIRRRKARRRKYYEIEKADRRSRKEAEARSVGGYADAKHAGIDENDP